MLALAEAKLFDVGHISYMAVSFAIMIGLLVLAAIYLKTPRQKDNFLKFWAIFTVILHYTVVYTNFLFENDSDIGGNMLFPIYPCNVCMWTLFAVSLIKDKKSIAFQILAEFTFWAGTICGIVGIVLNDNYIDSAGLFRDYEVFKGLVSHSTMIMGTVYLLVGKFIKIRVFNTISVASGLLVFFLLNGSIINWLYLRFRGEERNSMYLQEPPFEGMDWFNTAFIGLIAILVCFVITAIYEQIALKKEDRWYSKLKRLFAKK